MDRSLGPTEWKPEASAGNCTQVGMPLIGAVPALRLMEQRVVAHASFNGVLTYAAQYSGLEDQQLAEAMHISPGYMSRFMRGVAYQWARRLVVFMRTTGSLGPLQWLAEQLGCDVVQRAARDARIRALEAELAEARRQAA